MSFAISINLTFLDIANTEVEPLCVVESVEIEVEVQVVLILVYLFDLSQVPRFEARIEKEGRLTQKSEGNWQLGTVFTHL